LRVFPTSVLKLITQSSGRSWLVSGAPVGDLAVAVADVQTTRIGLEIVAEDLVAVAEDTDPVRAAQIVAVHLVLVAVTQRQLRARRIEQRVIANDIRARLIESISFSPVERTTHTT
jgi:hypothetical protein